MPNPGKEPPQPWLARVRAWLLRWQAGRHWGSERQRYAIRRTLAERSTFPSSVHSAAGAVIWANAAFDRLCGLPAGGSLGRTLQELLSIEDDDRAAAERLHALRADGIDGQVTVTGHAPGGPSLCLLAESLQLPSFASGPARVLVHWFDQTEQVRTRQRLQSVLTDLSRERERLGHILAGTQVGAWEVNLITGEARMDDAWADMFGWRRAELEPWSRAKARDMLHPDDRAATDLQVRQHLAGQLAGIDIEQRVLHRSGEWMWVHSRGKIATHTDDGRPEWLSGSHMDIRERKRQQAELEDQRAYMRLVLSSLPGVVFEFVAVDDHGAFRVTYLSDALRSMFGIEPEDALADNHLLFATVPDEDMASLRAAIAASAQQMALLEHEYRVVLRNGRQRWMGLHAQPSRRPDGACCWHGMLFDLTRRRELAEQLAQAREAAEQANRAKSAFLATMSHEIRSPMNGVLGMTDVLISSASPEDQADAVQTIRESAHALLNLIDDILDFSKIEAGRLDLERLPLNPAQLFESVAEAQASSSAAEGVAISLHFAPNLPEAVFGDPTRLRQILVNLTSNAIKFSRREASSPGRVRLAVVRADDPATGLVFRIEDQGIGMDEATVARLFQPFTQADASTTRRYGGTGLGLAIVKRLVDAMAGRISVTSTPGHGTRFDVLLPLPTAVAGPEQPPRTLVNVRCLLVGEDDGTFDDLQHALCTAGAEVERKSSLHELGPHPAGVSTVAIVPSMAPASETLPLLAALQRDAQADLRFLLLSPMGRPQPLQIIAPDVGIARAIRRQSLWRAVTALAGKASPDVPAPSSSRTPPLSSPMHHDRTAADASRRPVLVVDDDATNRKVAQRQLQLLGMQAELAIDGEDGLAAWRRGRHALVLTDLHMPGLDGYSFVRMLRAEEAEQGLPRTPVLALTANALRGEEQRALEAGIDAVLIKPLALDVLNRAIQRSLPPQRDAATPPPTQAADVLDLDVLRALVGGDTEVVNEFLVAYLQSFTSGCADIRTAFDTGDATLLMSAAHKLKSASKAVGASAFGAVCDRLERGAADADSRRQLRRDFEHELLALRDALHCVTEGTGNIPG